jgi:hypothetical protein
MILTIQRFKALINDCNTIWDYYERIGSESLSDSTCTNFIFVYISWLIVYVIVLGFRIFGFYYMIKGFLKVRAEDLEHARRRKQKILKKERRVKKEQRQKHMEK